MENLRYIKLVIINLRISEIIISNLTENAQKMLQNLVVAGENRVTFMPKEVK